MSLIKAMRLDAISKGVGIGKGERGPKTEPRALQP